MSYRMETELFFSALNYAERVLADKQRLLEDLDGEQVNRSDLSEARDALQGLVQQTESLFQYCRFLNSDEAEKAAVVKIERLQEKLQDARRQTNRSNRKVKQMKRKLTRMEEECGRICNKITEDERLREEDMVDLGLHPTYPDVERLSLDEWGVMCEVPPDAPHLWKYEGIEH